MLTCSKPVTGKYVYVRTLVNDWLTLCEVQVYAFKPGTSVRTNAVQLSLLAIKIKYQSLFVRATKTSLRSIYTFCFT